MNTIKHYYLITFILLLTQPQISYAQVYISVNAGLAYVEQNNIEFWQQNYEIKGTSFTRRLTVGYQSKTFGIELGHRLLANLTEENDLYVLNIDKKGWEVSGRGKYSFGNISMYLKAGALFLSNRNYYTLIYDQNINTYRRKVKSQDFLWGTGFEMILNKWVDLRVEFESLSQRQFTDYFTFTFGTVIKLSDIKKPKQNG